jgi:hypothetical protein
MDMGPRAGMATAVPRSRVGFRANHTEVRSSLSAELQEYLKTLDPWMSYIIEYRDALAHRIPLYVPPGGVPEKDVDAYNALSERMSEALYVRQNGYEYERLSAKQEQLLTFQPLIAHSVRETTYRFAFHVQMLADFLTVEELGQKMLAEFESARTS